MRPRPPPGAPPTLQALPSGYFEISSLATTPKGVYIVPLDVDAVCDDTYSGPCDSLSCEVTCGECDSDADCGAGEHCEDSALCTSHCETSAEDCAWGTGDEDGDTNCNWDSRDCARRDDDCAVGVTGGAAPASYCPGQSFTVSCDASLAQINSLDVTLGSSSLAWLGWSG